ncbi:MAG: HAMP domain-containing methyl-accepting chemotaxis protein [Desulfuromonadaceae bacterium]|nr:HAMP domain-containing methyl-accepting chemotaxis protein [Desulfuromonadaceae bacterium]
MSSAISVLGIISIAVFSLMTILMVKGKITLLTSQSTPLQVKTVQFQQAVEKLSAGLLQLGLAHDPQEVKQISDSISLSRENLERINTEINSIKKTLLDIGEFSKLHDQVLKATDDKFKSISVFKEEASNVNGAMVRVDNSLAALKDIISGLVISASRRASTATKTLNEAIGNMNTATDLLANVQNFRNEVDHDIELNKKINAINDVVYSIGVDAKLLDAKARMIMLSETPDELEKAIHEVQVIQSRITGNVSHAGTGIKEIKSSGFVDDAVASIKSSISSAGASLKNIGSSQKKVLDSMALVDESIKKVKSVALEQGRKSAANVQSTELEQQKFVTLVTQRVDLFKKLLVIISLAVIALVLLLTITTTLCIVRSLARINGSIVTIAESGDFTRRAEIRNNDEFAVTITAFNKLLDSFSRILAKVSDSSTKLTRTSQELHNTAQGIQSITREQTTNVGQVAAAAVEMSQTISMISQNTSKIADSATAARELAAIGADVVTQTGQEVQEIARAVQESTEVMQALDERSQQVGEIVDVIIQITDQTNLLALNAAIEAARAGEHGRGFAVVADEVRKLATNTAEATVGITERVKAIQSDAGQAVTAMNKSLERVKRGVEHAGQAGDSLRLIVASVTSLQGMASEIASASVEMSATAEQISIDIVGIEKVSEETAKAATAIAAESDALAGLSVELKDEISQFTHK